MRKCFVEVSGGQVEVSGRVLIGDSHVHQSAKGKQRHHQGECSVRQRRVWWAEAIGKICSLRLFTATFGRSCSGDYPIVTNGVFFSFIAHSSLKNVSKRAELSELREIARFLIYSIAGASPSFRRFSAPHTPPRAASSGPCRAAHTPNPPAPLAPQKVSHRVQLSKIKQSSLQKKCVCVRFCEV